MNDVKKFFAFLIIIALGGFLFYKIFLLSEKNPNFDDKEKWSNHEVKLKAIEQKMENLSGEIKKKMGAGACEFDYECRVTGLGVKICDGYKNFLVYSLKDTNESELLNVIEKFNQASTEFNELSLNVEKCGETPKVPRCFQNRCTTASSQ